MDNDQKFIVAIVLIISLAVTTCLVGGIMAYNQRARLAFENGLEEGSIIGQPGSHWVSKQNKPNETNKTSQILGR